MSGEHLTVTDAHSGYALDIPGYDAPDLAWLGHLNLLEYCRESARWARGGKITEASGVLLCAGGTWIPVNFNTAWRTRESVPPQEVLSKANRFFGPLGAGYTVRLREGIGRDDDLRQLCLDRGIEPFDEPAPEMVSEHRVSAPVPDGVAVAAIESAEDVAQLGAVIGAAYATYGLPDGEADIAFGNPEALLGAPNVFGVIARSEGRPVAAALGLLSHGIGGLYWVGTVEAARGRGLGGALAAETTNQGFDRGAAAMTLQASVMGRPIYERLGYRTLFNYRNYVCWSVPPEDGT